MRDFPQVEVASRAAWRAWLVAHHTEATSIWLVTWKAGDPRCLAYGEVVEEALCFGWVAASAEAAAQNQRANQWRAGGATLRPPAR